MATMARISVFRLSFRVLLLGVLLAIHTTASAIIAPLYYDPATGNLTADMTNAPGNNLTGYSLHSYDAFISANHTLFFGSTITTSIPSVLAEADLGTTQPGPYSFGNVLPSGLSEIDALNLLDLSGSVWNGDLGTEPNQFGLVYGPSPYAAINDPNPPAPITNWATEATLIYFPATGNLTLDTTGPNGGAILAIDLRAAENTFDFAAFVPPSANGIQELSTSVISHTDLHGFSAGFRSLGNVMSPGLSLVAVEQAFTAAKFLGEPGHDLQDLDVSQSGLNFAFQLGGAPVPEPSTYALAAIGLLGLALLARRTR